MPLGITGHRRMSLKGHGSGGSVDEGRPGSAGGGEEETIVDDQQGNVLSHIISQLRPGADLSRVTLPTFILEPRSMLERITNFMAHPENLLPIPALEDPVQRFVAVVKFYMSGWHIKPPGVKKPLNPILGEVFTGYWNYNDGTQGLYISEQTSHHPPKSSYYFAIPAHHIRVDGTLKPRSKFLGNSVGSFMEGVALLRFTNHTQKTKSGERYFVTQPNMYARGILFGKMKYELGDHVQITCPENHLTADIEFKTKGWVGGGYNLIGGTIKDDSTGHALYELSGNWTSEMFIKDLQTGKKDLLFDATHAKHTPPSVRPVEEQHERESQKLWAATNKAIKEVNHEAATDAKTAIEEQQRAEAAQRHERGEEWRPKLFRPVPPSLESGEDNLDWIISADIKGSNVEEMIRQINAIYPVLPGSKAPMNDQKAPAPASTEAQVQNQAQDQVQAQVDGPAPDMITAPHGQNPSKHADTNLVDVGDTVSTNTVVPPPGAPQTVMHPLSRQDTETGEKDEFVDAQG